MNLENLGKTVHFLFDLYGDDLVEHVFESIIKFKHDELEFKHIKYLPIFLIKTMNYEQLIKFWTMLPTSVTTDVDFLKNLPCYKHYNQPWMRTHIDGPPPKRGQCVECIKSSFAIDPLT